MSKTFGYARVSTGDQNLTLQRDALTKAGAAVVFEEKASGTKRDGRDELDRVLKVVSRGDTILITRIDRLARSMRDLQNIVHDLKERGVHLKATEQAVDTSTSAGKAFLDMLGVFAEFETNLRRERQAEGIAKAKADEVYKGGKRRIDRDRVLRLSAEGQGPGAIAKALNVSRRQIHRIIVDAAPAQSPAGLADTDIKPAPNRRVPAKKPPTIPTACQTANTGSGIPS
jgi:DNA invertase Pin-like site-specific DNA recombinase